MVSSSILFCLLTIPCFHVPSHNLLYILRFGEELLFGEHNLFPLTLYLCRKIELVRADVVRDENLSFLSYWINSTKRSFTS